MGNACIPGSSMGSDFDADFAHKLQQKKLNKVKSYRGDEQEISFDLGEPKPGPSLLNQLMPGQVFDPRQIDFSALTLPNSHRSTKSKNTKNKN